MKAGKFETGTLVVDTALKKLGKVMGSEGPYVQLRAPGGGREWEADPECLRPADEDERLRANVLEAPLAYVEGMT
ncbi:hypothetical protein [Streptomyces sp. KL116D]|uniref:hypothetical protein n=1 Tax=Streptomyces sp. KL116D TaxID=3045152 RepID=UPI003556ADB8